MKRRRGRFLEAEATGTETSEDRSQCRRWQRKRGYRASQLNCGAAERSTHAFQRAPCAMHNLAKLIPLFFHGSLQSVVSPDPLPLTCPERPRATAAAAPSPDVLILRTHTYSHLKACVFCDSPADCMRRSRLKPTQPQEVDQFRCSAKYSPE